MADINNYGAPGDALDTPSLSIWAGAVVDVLNASNTTVDDRITAVSGNYLPISGGTLTGPLGVQEISNGTPNPLIDSYAITGHISDSSASIVLPVDIDAGSIIVVLNMNYNTAAGRRYPTNAAELGYREPDGFPPNTSHVGEIGSNDRGGNWLYKIADGTEGGTTLTFTYGGSERRRLLAIVVKNAPDPATTPWEYWDGNAASQMAAGVKTWSSGGMMIPVSLNTTLVGTTSGAVSPWGTQLIQTGPDGAAVISVGVAYGYVGAGPNPEVAWQYETGSTGIGTLLIPGGATSSVVYVNSIDMSSQQIYGLPDPTSATHAARKQYVDAGLATKADAVHTHVEADITDLGAYPDSTGVSAGQMAQTDGANGWTFANSNFVIALPTADPVPPGTPSGTIIVRY